MNPKNHSKAGRSKRPGNKRSVTIRRGIPKRKHAKKLAQERDKRYKFLFDNSPDGIVIAESETGRFLEANHTFSQMLGYSPDEIKTLDVKSIHPADLLPRVLDQFQQLVHGKIRLSSDIPVKRKDGTVFIAEIHAFPLMVDGKNSQAGVFKDITRRKQLEKQILEISDREQVRLGQDLHDGLCQQLFSLELAVGLVQQDMARGSQPKVAPLDRIRLQLDEAITQAHNLAYELYPVGLTGEGLGAALRKLAVDITQRCRVRCEADCAEAVVVNNLAVATHVYRIAQEAVHNAIRHAQPTEIHVALSPHGKTIRLTVTDDGKGLDKIPEASSGMGLSIMKYRASMIGGELKIGRGPSGGTIITCQFPRSIL